MNDTMRKHFPTHVIGNAHHRHDGEDKAEHPDMDRHYKGE
jgi:hypothetical protein